MRADEQKKKGSKSFYDFVLGRFHSLPRLYVAHGPWAGHPCKEPEINALSMIKCTG